MTMRDEASKTWNRDLLSSGSTSRQCRCVRASSKTLAPNESVDHVPIMFSHAPMATGRQFDLPYLVEQWDVSDAHVEELIALVGDYGVARAAYEASADQGGS